MSRKISAIKPSLSGFNTSKNADRSTAVAFIASYCERYPERKDEVKRFFAHQPSREWLIKMLSKESEVIKPIPVPKPVEVRPQRTGWIPRDMWIPDNPSPRATYKHEATRIAQNMRKQLEAEEGQ